MRWSWFALSVSFLLLGSYLDNVRGPLIPALAQFLHFDYSTSSLFLISGHFTAAILTWALMPLLNRLPLSLVSTMTGLACVGVCGLAFFVDSATDLILWGGVLGGAISMCGTISNLLVQRASTAQTRTKAVSASHASYGLASFIAPTLAAAVLVVPKNWSHLYLWAIPAFVVLSFAALKTAPSEARAETVSARQPIHLTKLQWVFVATVMLYVGGEVLASMWMTSWFVSEGHSLQTGAWYTALFFALMTLTRLLCSVLISARYLKLVLCLSLLIPIVSFTAGRLAGIPWLVAGMGLLGPFFPLFVSQLSVRFPERDRSITIWILSLMQAVLGVVHLVMGKVAVAFDMSSAYWIPPVMLGLSFVLMMSVLRHLQEPAHS